MENRLFTAGILSLALSQSVQGYKKQRPTRIRLDLNPQMTGEMLQEFVLGSWQRMLAGSSPGQGGCAAAPWGRRAWKGFVGKLLLAAVGFQGIWGENLGKLLLNEGFVGLEGSAGAALGSGFPEDTRRGCCSPAPQGAAWVCSLSPASVTAQVTMPKMNNHREKWPFLELALSSVL